jgi:iron complex transport system ATP-binding protein
MVRLAVDGLDVRLGGRTVLHDVRFAAEGGRVTGVIGPNGAGKSTLLRALAGLATPAAGRVSLDADAIGHLSAAELARRIAFLPQERTIAWPLSVRALVALGRIPHQPPWQGESAADTRAIEAAIDVMSLGALADRRSDELSGGEKARALLARALAQETPVIVADEPIAGLDPDHALVLMRHMRRLAAEGRVIVIALHELTLAARFCHDLVLLAHGRVAFAGEAGDSGLAEALGSVFGQAAELVHVHGAPVIVPGRPGD